MVVMPDAYPFAGRMARFVAPRKPAIFLAIMPDAFAPLIAMAARAMTNAFSLIAAVAAAGMAAMAIMTMPMAVTAGVIILILITIIIIIVTGGNQP